jgi:DNA replication protein DnaC
MNTKDIKQQIDELSRTLHLPAFRREYEQLSSQAVAENMPYEVFLLRLIELESQTREENRRKSQIRQAGFVQYKYLHDLCREDLPADAAAKLPQLEQLDFIRSGQNLILSGNPGTGKTHLATALGLKACQEGYKVLFTSVSRLLTQICESRYVLLKTGLRSSTWLYVMSSDMSPSTKKVLRCFLAIFPCVAVVNLPSLPPTSLLSAVTKFLVILC